MTTRLPLLALLSFAPGCGVGPDTGAAPAAPAAEPLAPVACEVDAADRAVADDDLALAMTHLERCVRAGTTEEQARAATRLADLAAAADARRQGRDELAEGRCEAALAALEAAAPVLPEVEATLPEVRACAAEQRHERLAAAVVRSEQKLDAALSPLRVSFRPVGADRWDVVVAGSAAAWSASGDVEDMVTAAAAAVCAESSGTPWPSRNLELRHEEGDHRHAFLTVSTRDCRKALRDSVGASGVRAIRGLVRDAG